jgi:molybdate-binding protein/DNA-binding XRE family transcriptional regulator
MGFPNLLKKHPLGIALAKAFLSGGIRRHFCLPRRDTIISMNDTIRSSNPVQTRRLARQWAQADLAERAGISRAAVSAIEGERLSPSVATALALAAVFECSVEELFGRGGISQPSGPEWAWLPHGESSRYWEATIGARRLRYPVEAVALNATPHDGVWQNGVLRDRGSAAETTLVMASCDPAAGLLAAEFARASGFRLLVFPRGGRAALELLRRRLIHVAGLHYSTAAAPERNAETARAQFGGDCRLLRVAQWKTGIALAPDNRSRSLAAVARRPLRWAARESGSAARECLDELLGQRPFAGRQVDGHAAVAEAVRAGWAEAGVCVQFSAAEAGLNFLPVRTETLDLCFSAAVQHDPRIQALVRLLRDRACRRLISELPGYDARETGEIFSL